MAHSWHALGWVLSLIDRLLPPELREEPPTRLRGRVFVGSSLLLIALGCGAIVPVLKVHAPPLGMAVTVLAPFAYAANLAILHRTRALKVAASLLCVTFSLLLFGGAAAGGGLSLAASPWTVCIPVIASYLISPRAGVLFAGVSGIEVAALYLAESLRWFVPRHPDAHSPAVLFGTVFAGLLVAAVEHLSQAAQRETITQLDDNQARMRALLDNTGDLIWSVNARGEVIEMNEVFVELFTHFMGARPVRGLPLTAALPPGAPGNAIWARRLERILAGESFCEHDQYVVAGAKRSFEIRFRPIRRADGTVVGASMAAHDVTEVRELQERLLIADRMSAVGTLAAGVAHELNNPLAFMASNVSFVVEELHCLGEAGAVSPEVTSELSSALKDAQEGAERMKEIIRDLKTFARHDEGEQSVVALSEAVESAVKLCWGELKHRAQLTKQLDAKGFVLGSASKLGQVVVNLVINAYQASKPDRPNEITVRTRDAGGQVVIEVEDQGTGIPAEVRNRIFDPFFTTKPVGVGTGLGLTICHNIVDSMGGRVEVESELGRGTLFRILLPAAQAHAEPALGGEVAAGPAA